MWFWVSGTWTRPHLAHGSHLLLRVTNGPGLLSSKVANGPGMGKGQAYCPVSSPMGQAVSSPVGSPMGQAYCPVSSPMGSPLGQVYYTAPSKLTNGPGPDLPSSKLANGLGAVHCPASRPPATKPDWWTAILRAARRPRDPLSESVPVCSIRVHVPFRGCP